jgi:catechol 2,3-dioxygenase-like lactoylglutathione lyase family enzyme
MDFYVRPPIEAAIRDIEGAGYRFRSPPIRYEIGPYESEELLFSGPDATPILVMIGHRHPPSSQRRLPPDVRYSEVPTVSVRCADIAATRRFYGEGLGLHCGTDAEVTDEFRDLACTLTGVPKGSRLHFLTYQKADEPSGKTLLIHLFERTGRRLAGRMRPGHLGMSLYTYEADDLDGLAGRLAAAGGTIVAGPEPVAGRRRLLVNGPNEELFEFLEGAP